MTAIHNGITRPLVSGDPKFTNGHRSEVAIPASEIEIARGTYGASPFYGAGRRITPGAVTNGLIWPDGPLYIPSALGVQPSISSTSASDTSGGSGVNSVRVIYLDAGLVMRTEIVVLAGVAPTNMVATDVRFIQCMHTYVAGSAKAAVGIISATFSGNTMSQIAAGDLRCRSSARMVPANKRAFITGLAGGVVSGATSADATIEFAATEIDGWQSDDKALLFPYGEIAVSDASESMNLSVPLGPFASGTLVGMICSTNKASTIVGTWFGFIEPI